MSTFEGLPEQPRPPTNPDFPPPITGHSGALPRLVALLEVLICSDFPTQFALGTTFAALGYFPYDGSGNLRVGFVFGLSLLDTAFLLGLILICLRAHGEHPRDMFLGSRPVGPEIRFGLPLIGVAIALGIGAMALAAHFAPSLHTVARNPLQALLQSPRDASLFALVVIVAGGVREEIQRAFLLSRFEMALGGGTVGVIATSVVFGLGHLIQGVDAAVATGLLGAFWGVVYLKRRSVVAPMVSHAGFDLVQILQFVSVGK